jgi:hypothetical protein
MADWERIETAPKDGRAVLVYAPGCRRGHIGVEGYVSGDLDIAVAEWNGNRSGGGTWAGDLVSFEIGWESTGSYTVTVDLKPTHWMPLPEPPVA